MCIVGEAVPVAGWGVNRIFAATGFHTGPVLLHHHFELVDIKGVEKNSVRRLFVALPRIPPHDEGSFGDKNHRALSGWGCVRCFFRRSGSYFDRFSSASIPGACPPHPNAKNVKHDKSVHRTRRTPFTLAATSEHNL
jgi:hypothetical protein